MSVALQQAWLERGWLACLLWPVSLLYGAASSARAWLYRHGLLASTRAQVPVIVVGNVVAGGAGKTPLIMALADHLAGQGIPVGIISRGYGRTTTNCLEVTPGSAAAEAGDEPLLIRRRTGAPVFVARRRADAARALLEAYPATQLLLCDDGLQHLALQRDLEIVVFDDRGKGNGWLLPAGPLREPWPSARRGSDTLVLHTGQQAAFAGFRSSRRLASFAVDENGQRTGFAQLHERRLVALAGIANPEAFFSMLRASGLPLADTISLPDHHHFSDFKLDAFGDCTLLCTEKDAVKLFALPRPAGLEVLAVPLEFAAEPAFIETLDARVSSLLRSRFGATS